MCLIIVIVLSHFLHNTPRFTFALALTLPCIGTSLSLWVLVGS